MSVWRAIQTTESGETINDPILAAIPELLPFARASTIGAPHQGSCPAIPALTPASAPTRSDSSSRGSSRSAALAAIESGGALPGTRD
jgi:hypothetical protein